MSLESHYELSNSNWHWRVGFLVLLLSLGSYRSVGGEAIPAVGSPTTASELVSGEPQVQRTETDKKNTDESDQKIPTADSSGRTLARQANPEQAPESDFYEGMIAWSTVALAIVTAGLWFATYLLGLEAKRTSKQQRAEVQHSLAIAEGQGIALK